MREAWRSSQKISARTSPSALEREVTFCSGAYLSCEELELAKDMSEVVERVRLREGGIGVETI